MSDAKFLKLMENEMNSKSDLICYMDDIIEQIKNTVSFAVIEFEASYKFIALYYLLDSALGKENIKVISTPVYLNSFKEDVERFENCFQKIEISVEIPTFSYLSKNEIIFGCEQIEKSFFVNFYESEIQRMPHFKDFTAFGDQAKMFLTEQEVIFDLLLKALENNKKTIKDQDVFEFLKAEYVTPPNKYLTLETLEKFMDYIS